ncbi:MAG: UbiD family decarboxylase [Phycisphaerae bacterium]|nr:UbiD family decarboxylase [Phycisphaerae bacterium]
MAFSDLQAFIGALESAGQLRRVGVEVDPELEVSEIANRVSKLTSPEGPVGAPATDPIHGGLGGRALLFERVTGSDVPLAINLYGSYARMRMALGCESFEALAEKVQKVVKPQPPVGLVGKVKMMPELAKIAGYAPKLVKNGICQQVVHTGDADLFSLPIIKCWPHDGGADEDVIVGKRRNVETSERQNVETSKQQDGSAGGDAPQGGDYPPAKAGGSWRGGSGGRYITLGGIITTAPDGSEPNVGMYRIQVTGPKSAIFHCHIHHDGARHLRMHQELGKDMPVAIVLGGESVLPYAATCPLPPGVSELLFAGLLNDGGIQMVKAKTVPLDVPTNAEIVIEGLVSATGTAREGPFGDHTGFYTLAERCATLRVTAITHRKNPIYPTTIVGPPPMEDYYLGKATERIFLPLLKMVIPDIIDYNLPQWGAFHNICFVKIRKEYPLHARKVASGIWGAGQMMFCKLIIVVDEEVNVHDEQAVMFAVGAHVDPRRDTFIVDGPIDILDHAAPYWGAGSKMCIDATRKIEGEGVVRDWPVALSMSETVKRLVNRRWEEYGLGKDEG